MLPVLSVSMYKTYSPSLHLVYDAHGYTCCPVSDDSNVPFIITVPYADYLTYLPTLLPSLQSNIHTLALSHHTTTPPRSVQPGTPPRSH